MSGPQSLGCGLVVGVHCLEFTMVSILLEVISRQSVITHYSFGKCYTPSNLKRNPSTHMIVFFMPCWTLCHNVTVFPITQWCHS